MSEMTMEDKIFVKQCLDEYNYHVYNSIIPFTVIRRIPGAAMKGDELKELSVITRSSLMNSSSDIYKLFNAYKNKFKPNASIKEIAEVLNLKESTVRAHLTRARQKLKNVLKEDV